MAIFSSLMSSCPRSRAVSVEEQSGEDTNLRAKKDKRGDIFGNGLLDLPHSQSRLKHTAVQLIRKSAKRRSLKSAA